MEEKSNIKIAFATTVTYPSQLANRIHLFGMCEAFRRNGAKVTMFARDVDTDESFPIVNIPSTNVLFSAWKLWRQLTAAQYDVIYCREPRLFLLLLPLLKCSARTRKMTKVFEIHDAPFSWVDYVAFFTILNVRVFVIVLTQGLKSHVARYQLWSRNNIIVLPDGVDMTQFTGTVSTVNWRLQYGIKNSHPIVLYTGSFARWKGVYLLIEVARLLPKINFVLVGGRESEHEALRDFAGEIPNVYLVNHVSHRQIPAHLLSADILVLPNSSHKRVSYLYTSPLKLFEYMASVKPIIASDLPSIREVLNEKNSVLFVPDDPRSLCGSIVKLINNPALAASVAKQAREDVKNYTWYNRAQTILSHLS